MIVFIDTNVLIDFLAKREPCYETAETILSMCAEKKIEGYISTHSILDTLYILRKLPLEYRRKKILSLCKIVGVVGDDSRKIINALNNFDFSDIEDCVQFECALSVKADYIITRNIKDFVNSAVKPILSEDFLDLF